jgi:hypothetical protein
MTIPQFSLRHSALSAFGISVPMLRGLIQDAGWRQPETVKRRVVIGQNRIFPSLTAHSGNKSHEVPLD